MAILTVLNDNNAKNCEEIHLTPFSYFLFWFEINIIIFLFSRKLQSVGPIEQLINLEWPEEVSNGLVVKVLDSQSRGPEFKTTGGSKVNSGFHPSYVNEMSTRNFWGLSGKK